MSVIDATEAAIHAAEHLTPADRGAVEALRVLAAQIDVLASNDGLREDGKLDNVSLPTYLKFCDSLGLTPAGRTKLGEKKPEAPGGKLALLRGDAQSRKAAR